MHTVFWVHVYFVECAVHVQTNLNYLRNTGFLLTLFKILYCTCSIHQTRDSISFSEEERIDILINNAGVICHPQEKTKDGNEWNFQVNYLGTSSILYKCTHFTLPGRIYITYPESWILKKTKPTMSINATRKQACSKAGRPTNLAWKKTKSIKGTAKAGLKKKLSPAMVPQSCAQKAGNHRKLGMTPIKLDVGRPPKKAGGWGGYCQ